MGLSVPTLPSAGGGLGQGHRVVLGGGLNSQGAELDSTGTGEGEQAGPVSNRLRAPAPREGTQPARASSSQWQSLLSFTCPGAIPRPRV